MTQNLSRRYEKDGFAALLADGNKTASPAFPVKANQVYHASGILVLFAETEEALKVKVDAKIAELNLF
jgi:hypothetical protein